MITKKYVVYNKVYKTIYLNLTVGKKIPFHKIYTQGTVGQGNLRRILTGLDKYINVYFPYQNISLNQHRCLHYLNIYL